MQFDITEILNSTTSEFYLIYSPKKKQQIIMYITIKTKKT